MLINHSFFEAIAWNSSNICTVHERMLEQRRKNNFNMQRGLTHENLHILSLSVLESRFYVTFDLASLSKRYVLPRAILDSRINYFYSIKQLMVEIGCISAWDIKKLLTPSRNNTNPINQWNTPKGAIQRAVLSVWYSDAFCCSFFDLLVLKNAGLLLVTGVF